MRITYEARTRPLDLPFHFKCVHTYFVLLIRYSKTADATPATKTQDENIFQPRRTNGFKPSISLDRRSRHRLEKRRVCLFVRWPRSDADISLAVTLKRHQRPAAASVPRTPANGSCDIQTVAGRHKKAQRRLLSCTEATAHSAPDDQTDVLCVRGNIFWILVTPRSGPRSPRLLGWHRRQRSHQPHDMVASRPPPAPPGT